MFHILSLVCFLNYGVNRRQILIAKPCLYFFLQILRLLYFINNFLIFIEINDFENKIVPFGAGGTAGRQPGEPWRAAGSTAL